MLVLGIIIVINLVCIPVRLSINSIDHRALPFCGDRISGNLTVVHSSIMCLSTLCLKGALFQKADRDNVFGVLAADGLPACWTVALATVVVLLRRHQGACQAFVAEDVTCIHCQFRCMIESVKCLPQEDVVALV